MVMLTRSWKCFSSGGLISEPPIYWKLGIKKNLGGGGDEPSPPPPLSIYGMQFKYKLDTETKGSTGFRNPRARGCSARGFLKPVDPIGRGI